jgi:hypothetical protein
MRSRWLGGQAAAIQFSIVEQPMRLLLALIIPASLITGPTLGADVPGAQFYELTTQTTMPHLEENLRYATTTRRQCLTLAQLTMAFPILRHPALEGCSLRNEGRAPQQLTYQLVCEGGHGTTGSATWRLGEHRMRGTLDVKLGGKNMTFSQSITAVSIGRCSLEGAR